MEATGDGVADLASSFETTRAGSKDDLSCVAAASFDKSVNEAIRDATGESEKVYERSNFSRYPQMKEECVCRIMYACHWSVSRE